MKILEYRPNGSIQIIFGHEIKQYDDSITVEFDNESEITPYWKGKTIKYNDISFFFGSSNIKRDGSYVATFWKKKPVW